MTLHPPEDAEIHFLRINPEPWTAPSVSIGRKNGKPYPQFYSNAALKAYKETVREELEGRNMLIFDPGIPLDLTFYFWRQMPAYTTDRDRMARKHYADATNMQKALEDALQGVLFANDRDVRRIESWIMEQDHDTEPLIGIRIQIAQDPPDLAPRFDSPGEFTLDVSDEPFIPDIEEYF